MYDNVLYTYVSWKVKCLKLRPKDQWLQNHRELVKTQPVLLDQTLGAGPKCCHDNLLPRKILTVWWWLMQTLSFSLFGNLEFLLFTLAKMQASVWWVVKDQQRSMVEGPTSTFITRLSRPSSMLQVELWPLKKLYSTSNSQQVLFGPYLVMFFGNEPLQKCSSSNEFIRVGPHPLWQVSSQKGELLDTGTDPHRGKVM